jgi:hypothetical protein
MWKRTANRRRKFGDDTPICELVLGPEEAPERRHGEWLHVHRIDFSSSVSPNSNSSVQLSVACILVCPDFTGRLDCQRSESTVVFVKEGQMRFADSFSRSRKFPIIWAADYVYTIFGHRGVPRKLAFLSLPLRILRYVKSRLSYQGDSYRQQIPIYSFI